MNRLSTDKQSQIVSALVEGNSINATCRMLGVWKHTVSRLLRDLGCACAYFIPERFPQLYFSQCSHDLASHFGTEILEIGHGLRLQKAGSSPGRAGRVRNDKLVQRGHE